MEGWFSALHQAFPHARASHKSFIALLSKYRVSGGCVASVMAAGGVILFKLPVSRLPSSGFRAMLSFLPVLSALVYRLIVVVLSVGAISANSWTALSAPLPRIPCA